MKFYKYILLLVGFLVIGGSSFATSKEGHEVSLVDEVEILIDSSNSFQISDVVNASFVAVTGKQHIGVINSYNHWFKVQLKDSSIKDHVLFIDQSNIDSIEVYQQIIANEWKRTVVGKNYPFSKRNFATNHYIISIDKNIAKNIYIKVNSKFPTSFNIMNGALKDVLNYENRLTSLFTLVMGIVIAMIGYNTFVYVSIRERVYLIYVVQTILTGILQVVLFGQSSQFFWPNNVWIQDYALVFLTAFSTVPGLYFMVTFLKTKEYTPIFHKIALGLIYFYLFLSVFSLYSPLVVHQVLLMSQPLLAIFIIVVAILVIVRGYKPARYYLLAWSMFLVGIFVFVLAERGVLDRSMFTILAIPFGVALEVVLLSLALANRINILKTEQEEAVSNSYRLEKEKATLIQEQNLILEQKVKERTTQLNTINSKLGEKNSEIENAYAELKNTQSQLVDAEKMSSLGQLTAGIAHEINNPINFVSSNVTPLKRDIDDLISLFEQTEKLAKENSSEQVTEKIDSLKKDIDYAYLKNEIDELLSGMRDGVDRTVEIIRGLKLFSRIDEDDLKKVDLEEGITATLVLLNSHLKHQINVKTNFTNIPLVECYGGKINQVFMNILTNAIYAINDTKRTDGEIVISTQADATEVQISISDNGVGMPEEVKNKLFEPFFTTKPVGEGTGLGLSIVFTIIKKVKGSIQVNSEVGKGTEFIITLPLMNTNQPNHQQ